MFNLLIKVDDEDLKNLYQKQIELSKETYDYNNSDSGFDLYLPEDIEIKPKESKMIDLKIKTEPKFPGGFYLYPRSSFSKTPLRLKNSVGIIDNQYRGTLKVPLENTSDTQTFVGKAGERYFQICHPSLIAMQVEMVDKLGETVRGQGGFGSTGK